jgi:hypothetical protein
MSVTYPLFVFEKDDRSMRVIESSDRILFWHEAIDIENDEYVFWDASGLGVEIKVVGTKVMCVNSCAAQFPLGEALATYAESLDLPRSVIEGRPVEIWHRIESELKSRPRKHGWLSRIFSK